MSHTFRYVIAGEPRAGAAVELEAGDSRHLARVVRRGVGDDVEIVDPAGRIWPAVVEDLGPPARVRLARRPRRAPPRLPVDLYVGMVDWGRLDLVVEKCTELGVARISLFTSDRARRARQEAFDRRRERMIRLSDAAVRQSGQGGRPALRGLVPFSDVMGEIRPEEGFLVDARGERGLGAELRRRGVGRAAIVVGPDSGLSDEEVAEARSRGLAVCSLGAGTLRAETAALVAAAVAADALGHLGDGP